MFGARASIHYLLVRAIKSTLDMAIILIIFLYDYHLTSANKSPQKQAQYHRFSRKIQHERQMPCVPL